jgi:hypothetical protein
LKKLVSIIAVGAIAVFAYSGRGGGRDGAARKDPGLASDRLSSKAERIDNDHAPERFDSLDAGMKELALELEKASIKWDRNRPEHESAHRLTNDWRKFSIERISALSTGQIRQLAEWMDSGSGFNSELYNYRQALIMIWASREPEVVRARLMKTAESSGYVGKEVNGWRNAHLEGLADDFHHARVGHAMKDPMAAWEAFLKDDANPRMKNLVNGRVTISELFREYSARLPEEAWDLAMTTNSSGDCRWMIDGFADGAPAGQDWEVRGRELAASLADRKLEVSHWSLQAIGERWIMEDPVAALDWYARCAPEDALKSANSNLNSDDPFAEAPPPDPAEAPMLLKVDLLVEMYGSYKDRTREAMAALDHLARHGEDQVAVAAVGKLVGTHLDPMDIPLLEVIARMPSQEERNDLLLQAVHAIPIRDDDPFSTATATLDGPNASLIAVRDLAARLDLPDDVRAEAEAAFRNVEDKELKALEESEQRRRNGGDPFSSR